MEHAPLVKALGGPAHIARELGLPIAGVLHWPGRGIPFRYIPKVARLANDNGLPITADDLIASKPLVGRGIN